MRTVGSSEARTRLPELLTGVSVEQGGAYTITQRGVPIAGLVGITHHDPEDVEGVISRMKRRCQPGPGDHRCRKQTSCLHAIRGAAPYPHGYSLRIPAR